MKRPATTDHLVQALSVCAATLGIASSLNLSAASTDFTDAKWISMGGIPGANGQIAAVVADSSGNLYIAGSFNLIGDVFANGIAKWNGTNWMALGAGVDGDVVALAVSGNELYVGG